MTLDAGGLIGKDSVMAPFAITFYASDKKTVLTQQQLADLPVGTVYYRQVNGGDLEPRIA